MLEKCKKLLYLTIDPFESGLIYPLGLNLSLELKTVLSFVLRNQAKVTSNCKHENEVFLRVKVSEHVPDGEISHAG